MTTNHLFTPVNTFSVMIPTLHSRQTYVYIWNFFVFRGDILFIYFYLCLLIRSSSYDFNLPVNLYMKHFEDIISDTLEF